MKIKTKLTLGVGLLFILILLLSIVGAFNINALKADTENILTANYNSLEYSRNMLTALESDASDAKQVFELNLLKQEKNNTEIGEADATNELRNTFEKFKQGADSLSIKSAIRESLLKVMDLNMEAIQRKSGIAKSTAEKAVFWIAISGTLCFLIAFVLLVNMPSNIANPIKELTESIRQIAEKNYSERVHFEGHNEFGQLASSFNTMAQKLEEYNTSNLAKLMMEKQRIETLINNMHNPVIGLDENLKVIFINNEALKISGLKKEEVADKQVQDVAIHNDLIRSLIQDLIMPSDNRNKLQQPIKIYADNKESYFEKEIVSITITPTAENHSKHIGDVILLQNITQFKELDFAKTNFIATVSHEFKTPISSIKMSLQLLENEQIGKLNDEQKQFVDSIKDDANRLLKITGELLNMTQVESGIIQISVAPSHAKDIVEYAVNATKATAEQKQIKFDIKLADNLPQVLADNEKTAWVLTNLLSNAIRYSYDNSTICIDVTKENNKVKFAVTDTGQGISPQYIDKIFDRYFRIPGTKKEGTGLGLSISKEFIEAQGGLITVKSDFGAGSTFSFVLNGLQTTT